MTGRTAPRRTVAVIGAGAAGVLAATRLLELATARGIALDVRLIDSAPEPGRGIAYATGQSCHLLNVPAGKISADAADPDGFVRWLGAHGHPDATDADFAPRGRFGAYLADHLAEVATRTGRGPARLHRRTDRVLGLRDQPGGVLIELADGGELRADAVVLAIGSFAPNCAWAPEELLVSEHFVADPWSPGALANLPADADVLLVGTGLTMIDMALQLGRAGRVVHAVSHRGLLPRPHAGNRPEPVKLAELPADRSLAGVRAAVLAHLADGVRRDGDWRPAFDGLRAVTSELWAGFSAADRAEFAARDARYWEVRRHRIPPRSNEFVRALRADGRLRVRRAEVTGVVTEPAGLRVALSDGTSVLVGAVVNCTGTSLDVTEVADPFVGSLLAGGLARPGPLGLGFDTAADGRLRPALGAPEGPLWTLGSLRRGNLWETTAFTEIREQAGELAATVLAALTGPPVRRRPRDDYALALSTGPEAAAAYQRALGKLLCVQSGAEVALAEAVAVDPGFALAHAALAVLGHEQGDQRAALDSVHRAQRAVSARGDDRERSFVTAVSALVTGAGDGETALLRHIEDHPLDAFAVSIAVPTIAFAGVTHGETGQALIESLAPAYGPDWWYASQLAFVRQEQSRWEEAEALASRALAEQPGSGHAVHARAHVFYETGQHRAGLDWLDAWVTELGPQANHRAHFSWHAALHELAMGDEAAVRRRYVTQLAPPSVLGSRALVDSASLLWRCQVTESWAGALPIGPIIAAAPQEWLREPPNTFAALHSAIALTAAGDADGLAELHRHAQAHPLPVFGRVVAPLCAGLAAVVRQEWSAAVTLLGSVVPIPAECGGSAAQREVVEDTLIHALMRAGRCVSAAKLLSDRLDRRASILDERRLVALADGPESM